MEISFSATGGMWSYMLGIASVIQNNMKSNTFKFSGVSGGVYSAWFLAYNYNINEAWNLYFLNSLKELYSIYNLYGLWTYNNIVEKYIYLYINSKDINLNPGNFCININTLYFDNYYKYIFHSKSELVDCIIASHGLPGILQPFWKFKTIHNKYAIDGGIFKTQPKGFQELQTINIHIRMFRKIPWHWIFPISSNPNWMNYLFNLGKQDCLNSMKKYNMDFNLWLKNLNNI